MTDSLKPQLKREEIKQKRRGKKKEGGPEASPVTVRSPMS